MQAYSDPTRESDPHALPDLEVFYMSARDIRQVARDWKDDIDREDLPYTDPGWYWWSCSPGCLPDSDPIGPFGTEMEALDDARGWS